MEAVELGILLSTNPCTEGQLQVLQCEAHYHAIWDQRHTKSSKEGMGSINACLAKRLRPLKGLCQSVSILVIGPSDMSRKVAGEYVSYPNITKIRDAMQKAARENDCAFWDLYSVMGGENSMVGLGQ